MVPLDYAAEQHHTDLVKILLELGTKPTYRSYVEALPPGSKKFSSF
jgi:hypothetical protein